MAFARNLGQCCDDLLEAVNRRDARSFREAVNGVAQAVTEASPAEVQDALVRLTPVLAEIPLGWGASVAQLAGEMTSYGADPFVLLPTLVRRAAGALEDAQRFAETHTATIGEPPDPEDMDLFKPTIEQFAGPAAGSREAEQAAAALVKAWFASGDWVQTVLYLSQQKQIRTRLPERERLTAAVDAVREHIGTAHWLYGLLLVLDDEPLTVLHRQTGRGYRVTISGIGDNFQLHTLLAAQLIGDESRGLLPGERPSDAEIAAASDGEDLTPPEGVTGQFNLVDAYGEWIWNEGRPADIPSLDGERVVVLDPPPYHRQWNAGRLYPLMQPSLTVDRLLPADETARWLSKVKPSQR